MAMDQAEASTLADLADDEIDGLLYQLLQLEDCMQVCGDSPFAPPAR
jgi:hypothetical protein